MAEQITHDVVNEAQSMGGPSPIDVNATATNQTTAGDGPTATDTTTANAKPSDLPPTASDNSAPEGSNPGPSETEASAKPAEKDLEHASGGENMSDKQSALLANGTGTDHAATDDISGQQAMADASGGSDTDTSRAESLGQPKDGKARSSSVKKPTTFKSVSVTKHFLAKTAVAAPAKVGEKAAPGQSTPAAQPTAKPRLVAKSGTGVGSSVPRTGLSNLNGTAPGPDGSKVWNKNRPVPVPPPKQFTDEELKQQFGIHMATRLQTDDENKESKWADIEDDEDDWAPETVEWMDGTKSTVKATENVPPPEEPKPKPSEPEQTSEPPKPPAPVATAPVPRPDSTSGTKTILKPGSLASTGSPKPGSLVLKGQPDKPTLVAKPSAPNAVKSPWAPLPPIEKVSPINPPVQQQAPARFSQRDPHGFDALPPVPSPAKEIAADDFNRTWREERGPRELFNSQSGRYEPVREMRRGSVRDQSFRQPSVLQRPSHHDQGGPAEPSASFQTSRSGAGHEYGGRRRTSSNVSGEIDRRGSFSRPQEFTVTTDERRRRGSHATTDMPPPPARTAHSQQRGGATERGPSPAGPPSASVTQLSSPAISQAQPASPVPASASPAPTDPAAAAQATVVTMEEQVAHQNQLMRERVERAKQLKQQRQDEEEKEELARKERLRRKLEALAPPPAKEPEKPKSPAPAAVGTETDKKPAPIQSPPKPPVPTAEGEVAQYGMMKVHQAHPVKKQPAGEQMHPRRQSEYAQANAADVNRHSAPVKSPGAVGEDATRQTPSEAQKLSTLSPAPPLEQRAQVWKPSGASEQNSMWGGRMRSHGLGGNVWGPPDRERGIGNGTFAGHTQQPLQTSPSTAPGPIAPPSAFRISPSTHTGLAQPPSLPHPPPPSSEHQPPFIDQSPPHQHPTAMAPAPSSSATKMAPPVPPTSNRSHYGAGAMDTLSMMRLSDARIEAELKESRARHVGAPKVDYQTEWIPTGSRRRKGQGIVTTTTHDARRVVPDASASSQPKSQAQQGAAGTKPTEPHGALAEPRAQSTPVGLAEPIKSFTEVPAKSFTEVPAKTFPSDPAAKTFRESAPAKTFHTESPTKTFRESPPKPATSEDAVLKPIGAEKSAAAQQAASQNVVGSSRSSRFFPRSYESHELPAFRPPPISDAHLPPTPPPDDESHPVYSGDVDHPIVKLPPTIRVRLPPVSPNKQMPVVQVPTVQRPTTQLQNRQVSTGTQSNDARIGKQVAQGTQTAGQVAAASNLGGIRFGSQPIVAQPGWRERINGLLGRPTEQLPSPPSPAAPSLAVSSESKASFEHSKQGPHSTIVATVSLPSESGRAVPNLSFADVAAGVRGAPAAKATAENVDNKVVSKPTVEDEFMGQPEAFSKPTVCLPVKPHLNADSPPPAIQMTRANSKLFQPSEPEVFSKDSNAMDSKKTSAGKPILTVHLPGTDKALTKVMHNKAKNQNRKFSGGGGYKGKNKKWDNPRDSNNGNGANEGNGNTPNSNAPNGNPRGRKGSGGYNPQGHPNNTTSRYSPNRNNNAGGNWKNNGNNARNNNANGYTAGGSWGPSSGNGQRNNAEGSWNQNSGNANRSNSNGNWNQHSGNGNRNNAEGSYNANANQRASAGGSPWNNNRRVSGAVL